MKNYPGSNGFQKIPATFLTGLPNGKCTDEVVLGLLEVWSGAKRDTWLGNCHQTCLDLTFCLDVKEAYGLFTAPVALQRYGQTKFRQGWLKLPDGRICDPTIYHELEPSCPSVLLTDHDDPRYDELGLRSRHGPLDWPEPSGKMIPWPQEKQLQGQFFAVSGGRIGLPSDRGIAESQLVWILQSDFAFFAGDESRLSNYVKEFAPDCLTIEASCHLLHQAIRRMHGI